MSNNSMLMDDDQDSTSSSVSANSPKRKTRENSTDASMSSGATPSLITYTGYPIFISLLDDPKSFLDMPGEARKKFVNSLTKIVGQLQDVRVAQRGDLKVKPCTLLQKDQILDLSSVDGIKIQCSLTKSEQENRAIIYGVPLNLPEKEITNELKGYGVAEAKRLSRWENNKQIPTTTILLKFSSSRFPERVLIAFQSFPIRQYIPQPFQCRKCWRFRHTQSFCTFPARCRRCGEEGHKEGEECTSPIKCVNCEREDHEAGSTSCPWFKSHRVTLQTASKLGISIEDAAKRAKLSRTPVTTNSPAPDPNHDVIRELSDMKRRVDALEKNSTRVEENPVIKNIQSSLASHSSKISSLEKESAEIKNQLAKLDDLAGDVDTIKSDTKSITEELKTLNRGNKARDERFDRLLEMMKSRAVAGIPTPIDPKQLPSGIPVPVNDKDKDKRKNKSGTNKRNQSHQLRILPQHIPRWRTMNQSTSASARDSIQLLPNQLIPNTAKRKSLLTIPHA